MKDDQGNERRNSLEHHGYNGEDVKMTGRKRSKMLDESCSDGITTRIVDENENEAARCDTSMKLTRSRVAERVTAATASLSAKL